MHLSLSLTHSLNLTHSRHRHQHRTPYHSIPIFYKFVCICVYEESFQNRHCCWYSVFGPFCCSFCSSFFFNLKYIQRTHTHTFMSVHGRGICATRVHARAFLMQHTECKKELNEQNQTEIKRKNDVK